MEAKDTKGFDTLIDPYKVLNQRGRELKPSLGK